MIVLKFIFYFVCLKLIKSTELYDKYELKMVHVVFRHGARTSATNPYPNDPYNNNTYEPYGPGQLTNVGKQQMFELGEFLRQRYNDFLGWQLNFEELHAQSSDYSRTKNSLQLVLAGLFPPKGTAMEWNKDLNWQPFPYDYQEISQDMLLMVNVPCSRYEHEFQKVVDSETKRILNDFPNMYEELSVHSGYTSFGIFELMAVYDNLKSQEEFGLKLPKWSKKFYPEKMKVIYRNFYFWQGYNQILKRLKGGVLLKKIVEDWNAKAENKEKKKIVLYSGHDITVINLMSALNIIHKKGPSFGLTVILELLQRKNTKEYSVRILLRSSENEGVQVLTINGCEEICSLEELKNLLKENMPVDWTKECNE